MYMPWLQYVQALRAEFERMKQQWEERLVRHEAEKRQLEERLARFEEETRQLKEAVERTRPIHIDNITYKVQELHVQELSGTLNIGLTALADPEQIEKWLAEQDIKPDNPLQETEVELPGGKHPEPSS